MSAQKQQNYQAPALEKGLDIIEFLAREHVSRSQGEIADALGRKQSEIYRMLSCLERRGYIRRDGNLYGLTLRMYQVGRSQQLMTELRRASRVPMERLAEVSGHSCHLSVQHAGELLVTLERMPSKTLCLSVGEGSNFPLWRTASGKVLLGMMTPDERNALLKGDESFNRLPSAFQKRVHQVAELANNKGYLAQSSDMTDGVYDIAIGVGIKGAESAVLALSCLALQGNADSGAHETLLKQVQVCAEQINQSLGLE